MMGYLDMPDDVYERPSSMTNARQGWHRDAMTALKPSEIAEVLSIFHAATIDDAVDAIEAVDNLTYMHYLNKLAGWEG